MHPIGGQNRSKLRSSQFRHSGFTASRLAATQTVEAVEKVQK
jgi:hypothetical protein